MAIEIRKQNPDQRMMIMSASPGEHLPDKLLKTPKIPENDIFTGPFRLTELIYSIELVR